MQDIIIMAIKNEAPDLANQPNVFFCGVGKINAAAMTATLIERYHPRRVINFGTAGGITVQSGLHRATRFVQRDMRCQELGVVLGQTPFELQDHVITIDHTGLTCSTGDDFVANPVLEIPADMVDMEAYAIAKVCRDHGVEFECWKYISDQADDAASLSWEQHVTAGQNFYIEKLRELTS